MSETFSEGAIFILQGLPKGSQFGIDCHLWTIGEKFMGIKHIPPGWHLITCTAVGSTGKKSASMVSFYHKFLAREMFVRKWKSSTEDFDEDSVPEDEIERFKARKTELEMYLGLYPLELHRKWLSLSNFIEDDILSQLLPKCGKIYSATQLVSEKFVFTKDARLV